MIANGTKVWIDLVGDVIHNYNHRVNSTKGKAPALMTRDDIKVLNKRLEEENQVSIAKMHMIKTGDSVRYLIEKSKFGKGGKRFSESIWKVIGREGYTFIIEKDGEKQYKKYWELLKIQK